MNSPAISFSLLRMKSFLITRLAYFSFFSIFSVFDTTTTIIETINVPHIATKKMIKRPSGVWG